LGTANPRLIDVFGAEFTQDDVDFAIPRLEQDIPLYVDPFLLWASEKPEYKHWHAAIVDFCHRVATLSVRAPAEAKRLLAGCREEAALGLGYGARSRNGRSVGPTLVASIVQAHQEVPQLRQGTLRHLEELQLVIPKFAEDMVSDVSTAIVKPLLLDFTVQICAHLKIPTRLARVREVFDPRKGVWVPPAERPLPFNPVTGLPLLLVSLDLLRHLPWINYGNYFRAAYSPRVALAGPSRGKKLNVGKAEVLEFNARNYVEIERYVSEREALKRECEPDPLFKPLATNTIKAKIAEIKTLPTGKAGGVDRRYEDLIHDVLASAFFPALEFAESKVRTISGAHIRDLIFYNDGKTAFWKDLRERYDARQPVFELKNVAKLETEHVNQLHRYLDEEFGRFGILVTRNPVPPAVQQNIVDLHSSKRTMILCFDDRDIEFVVALLESGRDATDICKRKYIELTRLLPK
jgi:hypothetical protein